jgi:hypothetical protein
VPPVRPPYSCPTSGSSESLYLSFFDEDDEPRRSPRPSRTRSAGGATADRQTVLVRQAVLVGGVVLVALLLFFVIRGCASSARKSGLRTYNADASRLIAESDRQISKPFFELLNDAKGQSPADLQSTISGYRNEADQEFKTAQNMSVPDQMVGAHRSLLNVLEFRRDGLSAIASSITGALSDDAEASDPALAAIAGQMQAFLASDVIYEARVMPLIKKGLDDGGVTGQEIAPSQFLPGVEWLSSAYVADKLGAQAPANAGRRGTPAPGLHGTGLQGVSAGNLTLQAGSPNRIPATTRAFAIKFTNQGENDESNVRVALTIEGGSKPIKATRTINLVPKGQTVTANLELPSAPPVGVPVTITAEVRPVPGEKKTDNNKSEYQALFTR